MDTPPILSPLPPRLVLARSPSRSPSRSPTRQRIRDDLLSDLSPATTLEAFTSPSGKLRASVEAASPTERAFGIRATLASKKIQEWVDELSQWPWPAGPGSAGFETPVGKRRKLTLNGSDAPGQNGRHGGREEDEEAYVGSLHAHDVIQYETRVEEIQEDMDDLDVEEIKTQVLDTFSPRSRPSSSQSTQAGHAMPSLFASYTKMEDFTAVVTATVLQALPNLSRLMRLMDVWSVRLTVLRKVPPLLLSLDDTEVALKSGWQAIETFDHTRFSQLDIKEEDILSRETFNIMRDVLQDKVTTLGQELDFMLDTLEGREDTLPDSWLDRMESIELDYGEWVVSGDRKVREGEWARSERARELLEDERRRKEEEAAAARKQAEDERRRQEEEEAAAARKQAEDERRRQEEEAAAALKQAEDERRRQEEEEAAAARKQAEDEMRRQEEEAAAARKQAEDERRRQEEEATALKKIEDERRAREEAEAAEWERQEDERLAKLAADAALQKQLEDERLAKEAEEARKQFEDEKNAEEEEAAVTTEAERRREISTEEDEASEELEDAPTTSSMVPTVIGTVAGTMAGVAADFGLSTEPDSSNSEDSVDSDFSDVLKSQTPELLDGSHDAESIEITDRPSTPTTPRTPARSLDLESNTSQDYEDNVANIGLPVTPKSQGNHVAAPQGEHPSIPYTPTMSSASTVKSSKSAFKDQIEAGSPVTPSKVPRFGHGFANSLRRSLSRQLSDGQESNPLDKEWIVIDDSEETHVLEPQSHELTNTRGPVDEQHVSADDPATDKGHNRNASAVFTNSTYSLSLSTLEEFDVEPSRYFQPVLSPIRSPRQEPSQPSTPTTVPATRDPDEVLPSIETPDHPIDSFDVTQVDGAFTSKSERRKRSEHLLNEFQRHESPQIRIRTPSDNSRRASTDSDTSTIMTGRAGSATTSPIKYSYDDSIASTPTSHTDTMRNSPEIDEQSPSAGRIGMRGRFSRSPSGSPPPPLPRLPLHLMDSPNFLPSSEPEIMLREAPFLNGVGISTASALPSPTKPNSSDEHFQQQISSLLESLPARIRLTSEPETSPPATYAVRSKKVRPSLAPSYPRPHSSMSTSSVSTSRAPTPFLTLAPAYARNPRPRATNGNPEIKLYHLSRSTGEAPIKLFVRLVGEHGERVMVRVGGGWADLGEYLKEYAAHHGRRAGSGVDLDNLGKVEIQDLPPRMISSGSIASVRNGNRNGRDTPVSRPPSAMDRERPFSSLGIRKPRRSVGVADELSSLSSLRTPSTPLTHSQIHQHRTPPSVDRSVSSLSWTPDEEVVSLGLAGPKSKRKEGDLTQQDKEWVEGMKEKVRQASAEKHRRMSLAEKKFGEMERAGGTKRLFPKGKEQ